MSDNFAQSTLNIHKEESTGDKKLPSHAKAVIIGGGVVGCSILFHLAKFGWKDVVLLERQELTAGSSWHAAGNLFTLTAPGNAAVLQKYTIDLYPELERESGQECGLHYNGELLVAKDEEEIKTLAIAHAFGKRYGIESEFICPDRAKELAPTLNTDDLTAILHEKTAGYCDPASVTHAFAKAALIDKRLRISVHETWDAATDAAKRVA